VRPKTYWEYMARLALAGLAFFMVGVSNLLGLDGPIRWVVTTCLGCVFAVCLSQTPRSNTPGN
jgi:hypothetical protein